MTKLNAKKETEKQGDGSREKRDGAVDDSALAGAASAALLPRFHRAIINIYLTFPNCRQPNKA